MSLQTKKKILLQLMSEFEMMRQDPSDYVSKHFDEMAHKIDLQRDFLIRELVTKINEHYMDMHVKLTKVQTFCIDNIKIGMENCFNSKLTNCKKENGDKIKKLLIESKKTIEEILYKENSAMDKRVQIETKLFKLQYKLKPSLLAKFRIQKLPDLNKISVKATFDKHFSDIHKIIKVPNKNEILSASMDNSIKLWDLEAGACKWMICVNDPIFQVYENEIICAQKESSLQFYDLETGRLKQSFINISFEISSILVLNGETILTGLSNGEILVWSRKACKITDVFPGHKMNVSCLSSLNRAEILSASWDNSIKLWDFKKKKFLRSFNGHMDWVTCLEVFNQNEFLSGSKDGTIKIWHKRMGSCIETLYGHLASVNSIKAFENYQLLSCSDDGTLKHWDTVNAVCLKSIDITNNSFVFDFIVLDNGSLVTCESRKIKIWK